MEEMRSYFKKLTRKWPYPYQESLAEFLLAGKSVILTAPTGSGKTLAPVIPFLYARHLGQPIADRLLYTLPLRTLATSHYEEFKKEVKEVAAHSKITIQTGENPDDPRLEGDIIFLTLDQLLGSYLNMPCSLPPKLDNINAGALVGSLIVLDEFHLFEFARSMATAIEMIDRLRGLAQVVIMTATLPETTVSWLARILQMETLTLKEEAVLELASHRNKQRLLTWVNRPLTAADVLSRHQSRSIALCNTVSRAQSLYVELKEQLTGSGTEVFLLHSRFLASDRRAVEEKLDNFFGPKPKASNAILVSTQVVEAGIDISAEALHSEICPANNLIQRAGRCARFIDRNRGDVFVYDLQLSKNGIRNYSPYQSTSDLVDATACELSRRSGQLLDFGTEAELIRAIHAKYEAEELRPFENLSTRRKMINEAVETGARGLADQLIRSIDSVGILVQADFTALNLERGSWPQAVSLPRRSLWRLREAFQSGEWVASLALSADGGDEERDSDRLHFEWCPAKTIEELQAGWLIALNPKFASYSSETGLQLNQTGEPTPVKFTKARPVPRYRYQCELYREHVRRVHDEVESLCCAQQVALERLAGHMGIPGEAIRKIARLTGGLHDAGKLHAGWQEGAYRWQRAIDPEGAARCNGAPLAHMTYDPPRDWLRQQDSKYRRGPHSAEGAFGVAPLLHQALRSVVPDHQLADVGRCILTAIVNHHIPRNRSCEEVHWSPTTGQIIRDTLQEIGFEGIDASTPLAVYTAADHRRFDDLRINPISRRDSALIPFYFWLVRTLRLADQRSLAYMSKREEDTP